MRKIPEIQVAFQGGGAKFIAMLPIAHALKDCEAEDIITVSNLAGTSAGAICAALLATDTDFDQLRTYLKGSAGKHLAGLLGSNAREIKQFVEAPFWRRLLNFYGTWQALDNIFKNGQAVLNEPEFGSFLDNIFQFSKLNSYTIEGLPKKLSVVVTDLKEGKGRAVQFGSVKQAVRDSCALPIAFRSFQDLTRTHVVDGGLCDNLPVNLLRTNLTRPIFAVFPDEPAERPAITSMLSYIQCLFSASINNNVDRAKSVVSEAFLITAPCTYSTFDFAAAIECLNNDLWYDNERRKAKRRLANFARTYGHFVGEQQFRFDDTSQREDYALALDGVTRDYHNKIKYLASEM